MEPNDRRDSSSESGSEMLIRMFTVLKLLESDCCTIHRLSLITRKSTRTVQRDIDLLRQSGFPIVMDPETKEFHLASDYGVPSIQLTLSEALATLVLLEEGPGAAREPFRNEIERAALKIASSVSPILLELIDGMRSEIRSLPAPSDKTSRPMDTFQTILEAITRCRILSIRYKSPAEPDDIVTRIHPYVVVWGRRAWYVVGFASLYNEIRIFKISRILSLDETKERFSRPAGFSLDEFLGNAWSLIPDRSGEREILLRFSPLVAQNVAEVRWHKTQEARPLPDGSLEVRFRVAGIQEISWWILGYGAEVEVLAPPELRRIVREHAERMRSYYEK